MTSRPTAPGPGGNGVLGRLQARFGPQFETRLERALLSAGLDSHFARMLAYQFGFTDENLHHVRIATGKRFRPLLTLLAADGVSAESSYDLKAGPCYGPALGWQDALPAAIAVEMLHNFSLIHDDIEDRDRTRHHRPAVWSLWGEAHGINVGDAVFAAAFGQLLSLPADAVTIVAVSRAFQETAMRLTEGQYLDMSFETRTDVSSDEYLQMIERKTGALIAFSLWIGAVVGGASEPAASALHLAGAHLGKAFQIRDDIKGIWAEQSETGKAPSADLINRKKTLPVLLAFDEADGRDLNVLERFYAREHDEVRAVREVLDRLSVLPQTEAAGAVHLHAALASLDRSGLHPAARADLTDLAVSLGS